MLLSSATTFSVYLNCLVSTLREQDLNRADVFGIVRLVDIEFENVALAEALQFFHLIMIARDQPALHAEVAHRALEFALGGFEVSLRCGHIALRSAEFRGHLAELRRRVLFHCADLLPQFRVALLLLFFEGRGEAARAREFVLRQVPAFAK